MKKNRGARRSKKKAKKSRQRQRHSYVRPASRKSSSQVIRHLSLRAWASIAATATVLGLIATVPFFLPSVSVTANESADRIDPFVAPFIVTNDSKYSINRVASLCIVLRLQTVRGRILKEPMRAMAYLVADTLRSGESASVKCLPPDFATTDAVVEADITFGVSYLSPPFGREDFEMFRFTTEPAISGGHRWLPKSVPDAGKAIKEWYGFE